jgi:site-specific recombinase XerD
VVSRDWIHAFLRSMEEEQRSPATIDAYRRAYRWFWTYLKAHGIKAEKARITRDHLRGWTAEMRARNLSAASIRMRLAAISALFRWMQREGLVRGNPAALVPRPRIEPWSPRGALTPGQWARLWQIVVADRRIPAAQNRVALLLMAQAGGRRQEVLLTDWPDVDLEKRVWYVRHGKGRRRRHIPLSDLTVTHLRLLWERRGGPQDGPILLSRTRRRLSQTSLYGTIKAYTRRAGIPQVSPHWFRHTYLTELAIRARTPEDIWRIQKLAGHARVDTTTVYIHLSDEDRRLVDLAFGEEIPPG